jgi:hypothetical protein
MKRVFLAFFYHCLPIFHVFKVLAAVLPVRGLLYRMHLRLRTVQVLELKSVYIFQDFSVVIKSTTSRTFEFLG